MKLFSHNTMSYLPCLWWLKPIFWIGKCLKNDIKKQYGLGVRYFDLRIVHNKTGEMSFAHGIFRYKIDNIEELLKWIAKNALGVRVMLEVDNCEADEIHFCKFCKHLEDVGMKCFGGKRKSDGKQIYNFSTEEPDIVHLYSSVTAWCKYIPKLDDLCPWLYAKFHNKSILSKYKNTDEIVAIDFI